MFWGYDHCTTWEEAYACTLACEVKRERCTVREVCTRACVMRVTLRTDINLILAGDRVAAHLTVRDFLESKHFNELLHLRRGIR